MLAGKADQNQPNHGKIMLYEAFSQEGGKNSEQKAEETNPFTQIFLGACVCVWGGTMKQKLKQTNKKTLLSF